MPSVAVLGTVRRLNDAKSASGEWALSTERDAQLCDKGASPPVHTDAFLRNLVQTSKDKQNDAIFINFHDQFDHNFEAFLPLFATTWDIWS